MPFLRSRRPWDTVPESQVKTVSTSIDKPSGVHFRRAIWPLLVLLFAMIPSACTTQAPEGQPIDMEAMRTFSPFQLKGLDGKSHDLKEYLSRVTLVSFFFPT
jgi:cytochrome oxidase Cu insertion factor (SCO1/SenC/PrrC family)